MLRRPRSRPRPRHLAVLGVAVALLGAAPPNEGAAASARCTSASERILVTWGAWDPLDGDAIATRQPGGGPRTRLALVTVVDPAFRQGIAGRLGGLEVRTIRGPRGVGRPQLCGDGRRVVRLPAVGRRSIVGGVSVNGSTVAWRVWRAGGRGRVYRAHVTRGRLHDVQRVAVPKSSRGAAVDGRFVVAPDGLVAWGGGSPMSKSSVSTVTVWGGASRPRTTRLPDDEFGQAAYLTSVRPVDAGHVLTNVGDTPIEVGRPTRGSCPTPAVGTWAPFGDRQILAVAGTSSREESESDVEIASSGWVLVCDPAAGALDAVVPEDVHGDKYDTTDTRLRRIVRNGPWVLAERRDETTEIIDLRDHTEVSAAGFVDVSGTPAPADAPPAFAPAPGPAGVAVVPGAIASTAPNRTLGRSIVLRDATGRHVVGHGPPGTNGGRLPYGVAPTLTLSATTLTWTTGGPLGTATVQPLPAPAVTTVLRDDL